MERHEHDVADELIGKAIDSLSQLRAGIQRLPRDRDRQTIRDNQRAIRARVKELPEAIAYALWSVAEVGVDGDVSVVAMADMRNALDDAMGDAFLRRWVKFCVDVGDEERAPLHVAPDALHDAQHLAAAE